MTATNELSLIAELGVGFAGFVAIFLIFARREGRFSPADSLRVRSIITTSFQAIFSALFPLAIALYGISGSDLWILSSVLALICRAPVGLHVARVHRALSPEDLAEVGLLHSIVAWGLSLLSVTLLVANAAGLFGEPAAALYVTSLICLLGVATSNFVTIAFKRLL